MKPRVVQEDPAPHRFAQLVGGVFLAAASVFVITGVLLVAWVLAWIVAALAFLNFAFNICVGCIMYAQLVRVGLLPLSPRTGAMILLLAPLIAIAAIGGVALLLRVQRGGQRELVGSVVETAGRAASCPSILYFTGESCTICHTAQRPALRALAAGIDPGIEIREIDIAVEPELARRYRVMSLPTTIVLDAVGPGDRHQRRLRERRDAAPPARRRRDAGRRVANSGTLSAWPSPSAPRERAHWSRPISSPSTTCSATTSA